MKADTYYQYISSKILIDSAYCRFKTLTAR